MSTREEIVSSFYQQVDEDSRLPRSRHGQPDLPISVMWKKQDQA